MAIWYVAPSTVTTTGAGTRDQPFKCNAINWTPIAAGDTIYLRTALGNYNEMLTIGKSGIAGNYITIDSDPLDGGKAVIDGQNNVAVNVGIHNGTRNYISVNNISIKNTGGTNNAAISCGSYTWKIRNIDINNCYFGVAFNGSVGIDIDGINSVDCDIIVSIYNCTGSFTIKNINAITIPTKKGQITIKGSSTSGTTLVAENITLDGGNNGGLTNQGLLYLDHARFSLGGTVTNLTIKNSSMIGGFIRDSSNITFKKCLFTKSAREGMNCNDLNININFEDCTFSWNGEDGCGYSGSSRGTLSRCFAIGNGKPPYDAVNSGDGFGTHGSPIVNYYYCVSVNNYNTGFALTGTPSGYMAHCTSAFNGTPGITPARAGLFFNISGPNASDSNNSIVVKNCISYKDYPRNILLNAASKDIVTMDYNSYKPLDDNYFATLDYGVTNISWATYHASYEANSKNEDSKVTSSGMIPYDSPCVDTAPWMAGFNDGGQTDPWDKKIYGLPNIGADQGAGILIVGIRSTGKSRNF